jgi:hypothetical protein
MPTQWLDPIPPKAQTDYWTCRVPGQGSPPFVGSRVSKWPKPNSRAADAGFIMEQGFQFSSSPDTIWTAYRFQNAFPAPPPADRGPYAAQLDIDIVTPGHTRGVLPPNADGLSAQVDFESMRELDPTSDPPLGPGVKTTQFMEFASENRWFRREYLWNLIEWPGGPPDGRPFIRWFIRAWPNTGTFTRTESQNWPWQTNVIFWNTMADCYDWPPVPP